MAGLRADLELALQLAPPHLSLYQLTVEPNTVFAKFPPQLPDEDTAAAMHEWIEERTAGAGYEHYEVSAYARPGHACRHNLNYWQFGDYLGIGAGAHGKLTDAARGSIVRTVRARHPAAYLAAAGPARVTETREIASAERPFEFVLNALRLLDGFAPETFEARTALPTGALEPALEVACRRGLLTSRDGGGWRPTGLGFRFLNDLQQLFLPG